MPGKNFDAWIPVKKFIQALVASGIVVYALEAAQAIPPETALGVGVTAGMVLGILRGLLNAYKHWHDGEEPAKPS